MTCVPDSDNPRIEWWAFEIIALLAGRLPNSVVVIGSNTVFLQIATGVFMVYLGTSSSF